MFSWLGTDDRRKKEPEVFQTVSEGLKKLYKTKLLPLEESYKFHEFHSPALEDADFDNKPMVLLVGQYSTGKTSFIRYVCSHTCKENLRNKHKQMRKERRNDRERESMTHPSWLFQQFDSKREEEVVIIMHTKQPKKKKTQNNENKTLWGGTPPQALLDS